MNRFLRIPALMLLLVPAVSCMVDTGSGSYRDKYSIIHYSEDIVEVEYVMRPASAVIIAREAEAYLSLDDSEREDFDINSVFPGGIRHIDRNSINLPDCANVYSYGQRFGETGSEWTVSLTSQYFADPYYFRGHEDYRIRCIGSDTWMIVSRVCDGISVEYDDEQIVVKYTGDGDGYSGYRVTASGRTTEDGGYESVCGTSEDGLELRHHKDMGVSDNYSAFFGYAMRLTEGSFGVTIYRDGNMLDYCSITYTPDNVLYDVSLE